MNKLVGGLTLSIALGVSAFALNVPANHIVDAAWLKANIADKDLVIVDVRGKGYKEGHIAGAVQWEDDDFREDRYYNKNTKKAIPGYLAAPLTIERTMKKSGVNNDSAIVFYSGGANSKDYRDSALGVMTSEFYGMNNVAILDGGMAAWQKAGGEVNADNVRPKKGNFSFTGRKFNQNVIATGEDIDEAVETGLIQTVDANGKDVKDPKNSHWLGTANDPRRQKEGHLPGAKALHTKEFTVEKDGIFYLGDKAFVEGKMKAAGIDPTKPIIWYCNTGHLIAGTWFVAQNVVGMKDSDNRAYAGSMADYTAWPKRKLVDGDEK